MKKKCFKPKYLLKVSNIAGELPPSETYIYVSTGHEMFVWAGLGTSLLFFVILITIGLYKAYSYKVS